MTFHPCRDAPSTHAYPFRDAHVNTVRQFIVYIGIGGICAIIDLSLMQALILLGIHYLKATTTSFFISLCINFFLHSHFTFTAKLSYKSLIRYSIVVCANFCLTLAIVAIFHAWLDVEILGKIISLPLIAVNGYFLSKHWIYKH